MESQGRGVVGYALVGIVFVVVLLVVLSALGDNIGAALQGLVDQLPFGF